ncbi:hypothetical protein AB0G04_09020 [Actinoplanes sp. NPDC023801]|uniref:hypothetical protein n=1 Tax=Actinoplanes sp. NPDC023801 TaxID=3154595 RepID=UPI0033EFC7C7
MPGDIDVLAAARDHLVARPHLGPADDFERAVAARIALDEHYCREVADDFERQPMSTADAVVARRYEQFTRECREQYETVRRTGLDVLPSRDHRQPYRNSGELFSRVAAEGVLYVQLTETGHGPPGQTGPHPLREPSGVVIDGVPLRHNDLFRVVHDVFGHLAGRNSFGPVGELRAAYCHLPLFSAEVQPVLFTEHVAQTCWFYFGPHLRDGAGRIPVAGEPGHRPPSTRPYPPQKVYAFPDAHMARFRRMFTIRELV